MLHHIEPKYSLNCCIYLIWFEFETWFEFELKTLEKINRKAIRKSLEKRKTNSAQVGPLSPTPLALGAWQAGPACRRQPARPLSPLSLAAPWARLVGAVLSHACPLLSLSHRPHLSAPPQPPTHDLPAVDAPTSARSPAMSAHPSPFWAPCPARPPPLSHLRPLPDSLALSLALPTQAGSSATARRWPLPVLRPPSRLKGN
jgi:hypothetical protein